VSHNGYRLTGLVLALLLVGGCRATESELLGAEIEGYNHTSAAINRFTVNGAGGPNIGPYGGGGKQVCCGSIPRHWRPGLRAIVEWEKDPDPRADANWPPLGTDGFREAYKKHAANYTRHSVTVEIPQYDQPGPIVVHFLPCDQVRVAAASVSFGHPNYPYNYPPKMEDKECPQP
jgi:hypothetical protein